MDRDVQNSGWIRSSRTTQSMSNWAAAGVAVRDSKDTSGPKLGFDSAAWSTFLTHCEERH
jgi:hypothetical protein